VPGEGDLSDEDREALRRISATQGSVRRGRGWPG